MKVVTNKRNRPLLSHSVYTSLLMKPLPGMNYQWFSGDPSTAIRKARIFGRDDRVSVGACGGQLATFFQIQPFMPAASLCMLCHPDKVSLSALSAKEFADRVVCLRETKQAIRTQEGS